MTTAAEVLEKVLQVMMEPRIMELATIRAGENCNKHNIAATIRTAVDEALRAALAPPQAAPVQEPVRYTMWSTSDGYVNPRADPEGAWVLYAAPPQDEAVALLREAYNELIVDPEQDEATRAVGDALVERIRAFLKDRT